ncbi:hypothetical protein [Pseudonocardia phyllosphaerae]|uniref:hypothetical protein n=1 Tax=Pseudonocardia phyllosphaerae TaxID=3390502 RepID=UPI0039788269
MRTITRTVAALAVAVGALAPAGVAAADTGHPTTDPRPSACRPANQQATVSQIGTSPSGYREYSVVIKAAPGTAPCTLKGSPTNVGFSRGDTPLANHTVSYGDQSQTAWLSENGPVEFIVMVPGTTGGVSADRLHFTPVEQDGEVPGDFAADGPMVVDGTPLVGPVSALV